MFDPRLIDVAIGIIFLFLLVSLLVTIVQEGFASLFKLRASNLRAAIANLLGDVRTSKLYKHPLVASLYRAKVNETGEIKEAWWRGPSYIPSRTFVVALLDLLQREDATRASASGSTPRVLAGGANLLLVRAKTIVGTLVDASDLRLRRALLLLIGDAQEPPNVASPDAAPPAAGATAVPAAAALAVGSVAAPGVAAPPEATAATPTLAEAISAPLEQWFNDAMDRAGGWYKRQAQLLSLVIGFGIAGFTNADAVHVAERLWTDASLRASVTAAATAYQRERADATPPAAPPNSAGGAATSVTTPSASADPLVKRLDNNLTTIEASTLPVGWMRDPRRNNCLSQFCAAGEKGPAVETIFWLMLAGWTVTALATSLGAPFWFDLLSKALQIRSSGTRVGTDNDPTNKR